MKDDVSHRGTQRKRNRRTRRTLKMKGGLSAQVNLDGVKEPTPTALTHASDALGAYCQPRNLRFDGNYRHQSVEFPGIGSQLHRPD